MRSTSQSPPLAVLTLNHVVPQLGLLELPVFAPADAVYSWLRRAGEIERLNSLRHLGALSRTFPGARHARWDYTAAMLYYADQLRCAGLGSSFSIGRVKFSSGIAAVQAAALVWNVGHLPGTIAVEKGVYRFLHARASPDVVAGLPWPSPPTARMADFRDAARDLLRRDDYRGIARILAVIKLLTLANSVGTELQAFVEDFAAPLLLGIRRTDGGRWLKIDRAFKLVRHLAYLTLDGPYSGLPWASNIPTVVRQQMETAGRDLAALDMALRELFSPLEKAIFDAVYHRDVARKEAALVAARVVDRLSGSTEPTKVVRHWLTCGWFRDLKLGPRRQWPKIQSFGTLRLRSHFSLPSLRPVDVDEGMTKAGFTQASTLRYQAWNSDVLLEPDEVVIDAFGDSIATTEHVGRVILWVTSHLDPLATEPNDVFRMIQKLELEANYRALLGKAVGMTYEGVELRVEAWPLSEFGLFKEAAMPYGAGAIWASSARLDDPVIRHLLRSRKSQIAPHLRDLYAELLGVRELRAKLRRDWRARKELRQRWLVVTGAVRFHHDGKDLLEFDGGLLRVSTRSGRMIWYGLESKRGAGDPVRCLRRKLDVLQASGTIHRLTPSHAFVEMSLDA